MISLLKNIKNLYLFWYYECYLQVESWYKDYEFKKIYGVCTLIISLTIIIGVPFLGIYYKIFGFSTIFKETILVVDIVIILFTFYIIGKGDITDKLNKFYQNKGNIFFYKRVTLILSIVCICLWLFAVFYKYGGE